MYQIKQEELQRKVNELISKGECMCSRCDKELDAEDAKDRFIANIEAFELSGEIVCDDCAEEIFEENDQFGVGA